MSDITVKFEEGKFNFRVAVIVQYNEKILVQEEREDENFRLPGRKSASNGKYKRCNNKRDRRRIRN